ncbi:MAG: iron-containing alcohol dehydrogenase [Firmicutes bacterium]|nr:iron-containing alcohol dehydrogenase [Bacillota bacterium]
MNRFNYFMPTKMVYGQGVVKEAGAAFALGQKPLIVTGQSSARLSGALDDVLSVLSGEYAIFDQVENNPSVETVKQGGALARREGCDYVVAIGGGSPLDAAKVMAVLAVNDLDPLELYQTGWQRQALPIVAIPTTAGTGSEVTQYAVLTIEEEETKKGLRGSDLFPQVAYLDPKYTESLPLAITYDTAVDALSHLVESYLAKRATPASDFVALQGLALWGTTIPALREGVLDLETRDALLLASSLGGIAIAQTGTTLVHALGYSLTYYHGMPHGRANGVCMAAYLDYTKTVAPERVETILELLDLDSVASFGELMDTLFASQIEEVELTPETLAAYVEKAMLTNNIKNSLGDPGAEVLTQILTTSIG